MLTKPRIKDKTIDNRLFGKDVHSSLVDNAVHYFKMTGTMPRGPDGGAMSPSDPSVVLRSELVNRLAKEVLGADGKLIACTHCTS